MSRKRNYKACVVCGAKFPAPPSSKRITCSRECSGIRRGESQRKRHRRDPDFREHGRQHLTQYNKTLRKAGKPNPNQPIATEAAKRSPIAGRFETHRIARIWRVISPDGQVHEIRNLMKWCRDNPELFAPDPWRNAYAGLHAVQAWMRGNRPRRVSQWKGWTLEAPSVHPDDMGDS